MTASTYDTKSNELLLLLLLLSLGFNMESCRYTCSSEGATRTTAAAEGE
jgi:hypothetical protein